MSALRQIPLSLIRPNPLQPRRGFAALELRELEASIRANGLLQPVSVRATEHGYELIAGHRRYQAAQQLGWTQIAAVPNGNVLGFVILQKDGMELMYQSWSSVAQDVGHPMLRASGASVGLFIEVSSIDEIERQIEGLPITLPRRRTFYGMEEIGVTEAGGHAVVFAQPVE